MQRYFTLSDDGFKREAEAQRRRGQGLADPSNFGYLTETSVQRWIALVRRSISVYGDQVMAPPTGGRRREIVVSGPDDADTMLTRSREKTKKLIKLIDGDRAVPVDGQRDPRFAAKISSFPRKFES